MQENMNKSQKVKISLTKRAEGVGRKQSHWLGKM
jgi:hypothetical protein